MFFQIENTPERIRRSRPKNVAKESPKEECPRLVLAPFSRPPQVAFENVLIGSSCEKVLEVLNPSKQSQQITLGKALPPGLEIYLPGEWMELEPETCYELVMVWSPTQPTAMRETIRFTNQDRGRYDIVVVLKSAMNIKGKNAQPKGFKTSPGKMKKKKVPTKKSPVAIYKKKSELIYNTTTRVQKTINVVKSVQHNVYQTYDKENFSGIDKIDYSLNSNYDKCPFGTSSSAINFDTSEIFADMRRTHVLQDTYDKSPASEKFKPDVLSTNVLKPSNKQNFDSPTSDIFDNLTFTPLKNNAKVDKLNKGPKVIISVNSESELDDSLDIKSSDKENQAQSIMTITTSQHQTNWLAHNLVQMQNQITMETPTIHNKKHPNTSSPKEMNSPNFSINTEFSRISDNSFCPPRFSTERKCFIRANETHDLLNDKVSSDTYTKDSPNTPMDYQQYPTYERPPHYFNREQPKMCRQTLFREYQMQREAYDRHYLNAYEHSPWLNELKADVRSPPRSVTPPLQSIPEESTQFSHTQTLDKTDTQMATFTIDRTFDKTHDRTSMSTRDTWSKKKVRVEPDVWKVPISQPRKSIKPKMMLTRTRDSVDKVTNVTFEANKSQNQNITANFIGNVYSQTATVDPFLSATYFYDEEAVHKFENEFKRWLNCILTPSADLESNVDQKVDLGKLWIDSRNKEVPLAPTKEQVSSAYHNSHRLESLRRSARTLLMTNDMAQVFQKLNAHIEKKLITIRTDKNLHMDVGLQKIIMEIILSYNPLWLRIGLEAIYGVVLPLKSNSDIEGLTSFIIQRMFKNPFLKSKNTKSSAPNMLVPAYMEAIKKFTLKKFFMLVYFLDQAKKRKLISHDPCLFCRNAICKESREIIIRFTRELIAGIGDITKHLRPLGYVVSHKQSYLDEYKYAVHNLAVDIRDGVRLTKVMEIIMMKNGLLEQLRTPPISRLQKIHNVQVAMNALKEANFVIVGDITATDVADGHREKTLSLLWQIIHVFRAPLFEKAANVIQTWWRKKYEVIAAKREEERRVQKINTAATKITEYLRSYIVMKRVRQTFIILRNSTIVIQRHFRSYLMAKNQRRAYIQLRNSTILVQRKFRSLRVMKKDRRDYMQLRNAVMCIQARYRAQVAMRKQKGSFTKLKLATVTIQRRYRALVQMREQRSKYQNLRTACIKIQTVYRAFKLGRPHRLVYLQQKDAANKIQKWFKSWKQVQQTMQEYQKMKQACVTIQKSYRIYILRKRLRVAILKMKHEKWLQQNQAARKIQIWYQSLRKRDVCRKEYLTIKRNVTIVQSIVRMHIARNRFIKICNATTMIQRYYRHYKKQQHIRKQHEAARKIQIWYQSVRRRDACRKEYLMIKRNVTIVQSVVRMHIARKRFIKICNATTMIQRYYRHYKIQQHIRKQHEAARKIQIWYQSVRRRDACRKEYLTIKRNVTIVQSIVRMHIARKRFIEICKATTMIQRYYRNYKIRQQIRIQNDAARKIQIWYQSVRRRDACRKEYLMIKRNIMIVQSIVRMHIARKRFIKICKATTAIQLYYREYKMRQRIRQQNEAASKIQIWYQSIRKRNKCRKQFLDYKRNLIIIQSVIRMHLARTRFIKISRATLAIQRYYRKYKVRKQKRQQNEAAAKIQIWYQSVRKRDECRKQFLEYKRRVVTIQSVIRMHLARTRFIKISQATLAIQRYYRKYRVRKQKTQQNQAATIIQIWYQSMRKRDKCRKQFLEYKRRVVTIQSVIRMHLERKRFIKMRTAATTIQRYYRSYKLSIQERQRYISTRNSIIKVQSYVRRFISRKHYLRLVAAVLTIQRVYKLKKQRDLVRKRRERAAVVLQKYIRRYLAISKYKLLKKKVLYIQRIWRGKLLTRLLQCEYLQKRRAVVKFQAFARGFLVRRQLELKKEELKKNREMLRLNWAASKIQALFRGNSVRVRCTDPRVTELRGRWRGGALRSQQQTLAERNNSAIVVIAGFFDIETIIYAFKTIAMISEVNPMAYNSKAESIVRRAFDYLSATNRSISSVELLTTVASLLVNFARYSVTGPKIYNRERIECILRYMWRFASKEKRMFCYFATYLWLCNKYDGIRQDLTEFLHIPDNYKIMVEIKTKVNKLKRMESNSKHIFLTPQPCKKLHQHSLNMSVCRPYNTSIELPCLEPDFGICNTNRPRYFIDPQHAVACLFSTYNLIE